MRMRATQPPARRGGLHELVEGVAYPLEYVALLYYLFSVTTFFLKGADIAIGISLVLLVLRAQSIRFPFPLAWLAAFVLWALLSFAGSEWRDDSWLQWVTLFKLLLVALAALNIIRTRQQLRFTLAFLCACFLFFPFRGTLINFFGGYSVFGRAIWNYIYANPNDLAAMTILYASMAAALARWYRSAGLRLVFGLCSLSFGLLIFFTQSRGALVGVIASVLIALLFSKRRFRNLSLVFGISIAAALVAPKSVWVRLGGLTRISTASGMQGVDAERSAEQRYQLAQVALRIAKDHPLLGVGVGTYQEAHARYAARLKAQFPIAGGRRDAHNTWLLLWAETGIVGLLLFVCLLGTVSWHAVRRGAATRHGESDVAVAQILALGLFAFCVAGTFGSFAYLNLLHLYLVLLYRSRVSLDAAEPSVHVARRKFSGNNLSIGKRTIVASSMLMGNHLRNSDAL